jgi:DNA-binding transcriptional ArsR family regulator
MTPDDRTALTFKALAHPRRARIFRLLAEDPDQGRSFLNLQRRLSFASTTLVHHLREMERCGLVARRRNGQEVAYRLTTAALTDALRGTLNLAARARAPRRLAA